MSKNTEPSDEELLKRARRKDPAAFEILVARYERRVIGMCLRHLGQYEDACDLAQEIFVQVFQHLKDFEGRSSFSTWIYRVSLNACYNRLRWRKSKGRSAGTSLEGLLEAGETEGDYKSLLKDPAQGALENLEQDETRRQVREAVAGLDNDHRQVIELVDIEGLSYDEAGKILGTPVNTVRSRLSRARNALKAKLTRLKKRLGD